MKHAGSGALDSLEPLLLRLRALGTLRETTRGVFYAKGRAVLHFHEDPAGIFADIRPPGAADFERIKVGDAAGQNAVLARLGAEEFSPRRLPRRRDSHRYGRRGPSPWLPERP